MGHKHLPLRERFWAKVDKSGECWIWTGALSDNGYGKTSESKTRRPLYAHRVSVEIDGRAIPPGMQVDHLCRNKACVNPQHLEVVTPSVNVRRSPHFDERKRRALARTQCRRGHDLDEFNGGWRREGNKYCRTCVREAGQRRRAK